MNRRDRRAQRRNEIPGAAPGSALRRAETGAGDLLAAALDRYNRGQPAEAGDLARRLLARDPQHAQALNLLGVIADEAGRGNAAVKFLSQALEAAPLDPAIHHNIGLAFQKLGRKEEALASYRKAVSLGLKNASLVAREDPAVTACVARIAGAWPRRLSLQDMFAPGGFAAFAATSLLLGALLESGFVRDVVLERFLTPFRFALLQDVSAGALTWDSLGEDERRFCCALALQCFTNGYAFDLSAEESEKVRRLKDAVAAMAAEAIDPLKLVAIGAYEPLHSLPQAEALAARTWPPALDAVVARHIGEPREERKIRQSIQSLTPVEDSVSVAVQRQYEESPFPAWVTAAPVAPVTLAENLRAKLGRDMSDLEGAPVGEVLIAGCGTGRHSLDAAQRFPDARILAIDISRSSLAYAIRKTREAGIENIGFAHADILGLGSLGRRFDLIESIGVLHHLSDPEEGWRVLLSLLNPGGVMGVGLYSERARRAIVEARKFIAEKGFRPTPEDIRKCRQEIILRDDGSLSRSVVIFDDFFDLNECRDLLFNVVEHRFTIPRIAAFLEANKLAFLGFDADPPVLKLFREQHPEEAALTDLERWDLFEAAHPGTFFGMYQFYMRKPL